MLTIATWLVGLLTPLGASGQNASPIDPTLAKQYFEEAKALSDADNAELWGVRLYGPMIFADPRSRTVVANQADGEANLVAQDGVFVGQLPDSVNVSNTAIRWAGVEWTMVAWPLPTDQAPRAVLMAHELWHRVQDDLGVPMGSPTNAHLATADGRIWLQVEWRALAKALRSSGDVQRAAIEDALAFRTYRRSLFPDKVGEENALEMNEGLAEYTGVAAAMKESAERASWAADALTQAEKKESFTRSFAYASGPAYGLLLDQHAPGWRKSIKSPGDFGVALQAALTAGSAPMDGTTAIDRAKKYGGESLIAKEKDKEAAQKAEIASLRRRFVEGPTLRLPLGKSNISFDPNRNHPLDEGTVYLEARLTDAWGALDAPGGVFVSKDWKWATVPLKDGSQPTRAGEGWSLQLSEGWESVKREGGWLVSWQR